MSAYQLVTQTKGMQLPQALFLQNQVSMARNVVRPAVHRGPCTELLRASHETHRY